METNSPLVSIIMASYNRAHSIGLAIESVLNQTYKNIELIIVDDGSTDDTASVLSKYDDPRIKIVRHDTNLGVNAAKNSGLNNLSGEWFTTFDSDDEMLPNAIETMINIPLKVDHEITSVTCNCWEPISNTFAGKGFSTEGYFIANEVMPLCTGDYWGLNKSSLLMGDTFNENLHGFLSTLWYKMNERAKSYYIHQALCIIHVEGEDRVTTAKLNLDREVRHYSGLANEDLFMKITKQFKPDEYYKLCRTGLFMMRMSRNKALASKYYELLKEEKRGFLTDLAVKYELPSFIYKAYYEMKPKIKTLMGK